MQIELYSKLNEPLKAIETVGAWLASSGMCGITKKEQAYMAVLQWMTEGITPMEFMRRNHVMPDGKVVPKAHTVLADFRRSGGNHKWIKDGEDGKSARIWLQRKDGHAAEFEYTIEMARREGLVRPGSRWEKNPGQMLRARCETSGVIMLCPEIVVDGDFDDGAEPPLISPLPPQPAQPAQVKSDPPPQKEKKAKAEKAVEAEIVSTPVQEAEPEIAEPKAKAEQEAEQGAQISRPESIPPLGYKVTLKDGKVSPESAKALIDMVKARGIDEKALTWLKARRYIENGDIFTIMPERLQQIFDKRDDWFRVVEEAQ